MDKLEDSKITEMDKETDENDLVKNKINEVIVENESHEYFNGVEITKLTKSQMKKYLRMKKWEATKKEKRAKERLKTKKRKIDAKINNLNIGPSRKQLKSCTMKNSTCKIAIVFDLSFDELMISKVSFI